MSSVAVLSRSVCVDAVSVTDLADLKKRAKALQWAVADLAVEYLRLDHAASYADAANLFRVGVHQLRARVLYRYGSLENLRSGDFKDVRITFSERKCMCCNKVSMIADGFRLCVKCRA